MPLKYKAFVSTVVDAEKSIICYRKKEIIDRNAVFLCPILIPVPYRTGAFEAFEVFSHDHAYFNLHVLRDISEDDVPKHRRRFGSFKIKKQTCTLECYGHEYCYDNVIVALIILN